MSHPVNAPQIASLSRYSLLGRSGLRVSPLCLGTMTFGTDWGWGCAEESARALFHRYVEAGGNFVDTADIYTGGKSEEMVGTFIKEMNNRDKVVLATKYTFNSTAGDPNSGGNGRKNMMRAVEASLRRLQTDYLDLFWMHCWDGLTPVEEVMSALDSLVRSGKVRYLGLSDVPAWYFAKAQTLAEWRGYEKICGLQMEYSLVERNIEREFVPAVKELGAGICSWSPLAGGFLTGKYKQGQTAVSGEGRLQSMTDPSNAIFFKFTERNWKILSVLQEVARDIDRSPAQIALNWVTRRPGVVSTIIGATKLAQLETNLAALDFDIPGELSAKLERAGGLERIFPYAFFEPEQQAMIAGGTTVSRKPDWY